MINRTHLTGFKTISFTLGHGFSLNVQKRSRRSRLMSIENKWLIKYKIIKF